MADSSNELRNRRVLIWGGLLLLLAIAVALLLVAKSGRNEPEAPPAEPTTEVRRPVLVEVVDGKGDPIQNAHAFVGTALGAPPEEAGTWDAEKATLSLPFTGESRTVIVQARGYSTRRVSDVVGDRTVVLERGHLARFFITGDPALPAPPVALYVRLNPAPPGGTELTAQQANTILDLMDAEAPASGGVPEAPRAGFGFLLPATRAEAGVRLPIPGRYVVKWGFMDEKVGTWYGLYEQTVEVVGAEPSSRVEIRITNEAVALTQQKLREQIDRMSARRAPPPENDGD